jgi:hypothetical protein
VIIVAVITVVVMPGLIAPQLPASVPAIALLAGIGLLGALYLDQQRRLGDALMALFATLAVAIVMGDLRVSPQFRKSPARQQLAERIDTAMAGEPLRLVRMGADPVIWHLRGPLIVADIPEAGAAALTRLGSLEALKRTYFVQRLDQAASPAPGEREARMPVLVYLTPRPVEPEPAPMEPEAEPMEVQAEPVQVEAEPPPDAQAPPEIEAPVDPPQGEPAPAVEPAD